MKHQTKRGSKIVMMILCISMVLTLCGCTQSALYNTSSSSGYTKIHFPGVVYEVPDDVIDASDTVQEGMYGEEDTEAYLWFYAPDQWVIHCEEVPVTVYDKDKDTMANQIEDKSGLYITVDSSNYATADVNGKIKSVFNCSCIYDDVKLPGRIAYLSDGTHAYLLFVGSDKYFTKEQTDYIVKSLDFCECDSYYELPEEEISEEPEVADSESEESESEEPETSDSEDPFSEEAFSEEPFSEDAGGGGTPGTVQQDTKRVGNATVGFIDVPSHYETYTYDESESDTMIQFFDPDNMTDIVTMEVFDSISGGDAELMASLMLYSLQEEDADCVDAEGAMVMLGDYEAYQVYTYYPADDTFLVMWLFDGEDGMTHFLSIEFISESEDIWLLNETYSLTE